MNTKQLNKLTMTLAVEGICDANSPIWQPLQAFADAYADLKTRVTNIQALGQSQAQDNTGITQDKQNSRQAMCDLALPIASAVHAFAVKNKNNQLATQVDFSMSDLMGGRDVQSAQHCQNVHDLANTNLASLGTHGVTAAKLTALQTAITGYNQFISKPRDLRAQGKTVTGTLQDEFDAADQALVLLDDLIYQFSPAHAKFVADYTNARIIVDTAASHTTKPATPKPAPAPPGAPK